MEQWRPEIERQASQALGQPVRIGAISVRSGGWVPAFDLNDVQLLDRNGRVALSLGQVSAALAPQSLMAFELRLAQLHLRGVQLDVRRDAQGRIRVAGLDADAVAGDDDDAAAADWLFAQHEIVVRQGTLRWTDELRGAPALELRDVDLVLRNGLRRHDLRIDATPPPQWGERFSLRGRFTQSLLARRGDWRRWSGTLFADLPAADVGELRRHLALPFELSEGRGALRAWLDVTRGQWRGFTADLALADVSLRLDAALQPLAVTQLSGRIRGRRDAAGIELAAEGLGFATGDGLVWPPGDIALEWQQVQGLEPGDRAAGAPQPVTGGRIRAARLDLGLMSSIASRLPLGTALVQALAAWSPAGVASALDVRWKGALDAPSSYRAAGRVSALALAAQPAASAADVGRPGLAGAEIEFDATEAGGQARLAMNGGSVQFPGVFEQPAIALDKLDARLEWRVQPQAGVAPAIELKVSAAQFANADAQGELRAVWRTGKGQGFGLGGRYPGEIDLSGRLVRARLDRAAAYLPMGIPAPARQYVERALRSGSVDAATFAVKGDVWQFPFHGVRDGVFRIAATVRDAQFDYLPSEPAAGAQPAWASPWPGFTGVQGELVFDRSSMKLNGVQARLLGWQLRNVQARIDRLGERAVLEISGDGRGPAADLLRYVDVTPIGRWLGGSLAPMGATGAADLRLALAIPLADADKTTVRGSVTLGGNDIRIGPGIPVLAAARARVDFTERGFAIVGASARTLGGDLAFDGGSRPDGTLRFTGQGTATVEGLRRTAELPSLAAWASQLRGQAAYHLQVGIAHGHAEIGLTSDLVGLASEWPAPLNKPAASAWPLQWQTALVPASLKPGEEPQDSVRIDLGQVLQVRLARDLSGAAPRIVSGGVGVLEPAPAPASGLQVRLNLPALDADAWLRAWQRLPDAALGAAALPPAQITLRAQQLVVASRRLTAAAIELQHDPLAPDAGWQGQVQADQLAGRFSWRAPRDIADPGRLSARLSRLALPPSESVDVEQLLEQAPARVPALDVVVDDFEYRGRKLGRLEVLAVSRPGPARAGAREWRLDKLDLEVPEARLQASGSWAPAASTGATRRMVLDFGLDLADSGKLAARLGWADAVRGGKGRLQGRLAWDGSPLAPEVATLDGQLNVVLESGQFMRAEPGVGRLLGILSLQSLPRRLLLDFRDVYQEGFSFDSVQGDIAMIRGVARTDNLRMRGVQAVVLMEGSADLQRETQDLRVVIVPEVNAAAASLAYAAINPAVALGTFVAQFVLREPLRAAGTREFHITGPMSEPRVERVERAGAATPAAAPASDAPRKEAPG